MRAWTVGEALRWMLEYFAREGVESPRRSAEWLLSAATGLSRVQLYAEHDRPLSQSERATLRGSVKRRVAGEPLQYVTGEMPFRHIVLKVEPGVFIPRPETELLVEEAIRLINDREHPVLVDLCTGSGCVACAIAFEKPAVTAFAVDLSDRAVMLARANAERLGLGGRVTVCHGDLYEAVPSWCIGSVDVVVANPPYIPARELPGLPREVTDHEPGLALDGGSDGLRVARRIVREAPGWLAQDGALVMELHEACVQIAAQEAEEWYLEVSVVPDLTGRDRILVARGVRPGVERVQSLQPNGGGSQ